MLQSLTSRVSDVSVCLICGKHLGDTTDSSGLTLVFPFLWRYSIFNFCFWMNTSSAFQEMLTALSNNADQYKCNVSGSDTCVTPGVIHESLEYCKALNIAP